MEGIIFVLLCIIAIAGIQIYVCSCVIEDKNKIIRDWETFWERKKNEIVELEVCIEEHESTIEGLEDHLDELYDKQAAYIRLARKLSKLEETTI